MRIISATALLLGTIVCLISKGENLPEIRPALVGTGPKAIINLIDTQTLLKKGQRDAAVMFSCNIQPDGVSGRVITYRMTPGGEKFSREVFEKLKQARFIPAVYKHKRVWALLYGTATFTVVGDRPRLRIFLNQEPSELENESDFIAPQPVGFPGTNYHGLEYPSHAGLTNVTGTAVLNLSVDVTGKKKSVSLVSETPPGHEFGKEALKAWNEYHFLPPYRNGKPVEAKANITIYFHR